MWFEKVKALPTTRGFALGGVYARRKFCGELNVYRPLEGL
jgi:hypothetical protein